MLNDEQLEDYFHRLNLPPQARALIRDIRSSDPVRRTASGARNVTTRFASRKMGHTVQAESRTNELAAIYLWEHDVNVLEFWDQPSTISKQYRNKRGTLTSRPETPDFFLLHAQWAGWVECKAETWLRKRRAERRDEYALAEEGLWRCEPGETYADRLGLRYVVRSSAENNPILVRNLVMLADYLDGSCQPEATASAALAERMRLSPWMTLKALTDEEPVVSADVVFASIASGAVYCDLERELLAEPERARIYRDRAVAEMHAGHLANSGRAPAPIRMQSGEHLKWDGVPWQILNAGTTEVLLKGPNDTLEPLAHDAFQNLVVEGHIEAVTPLACPQEQAAKQVVQRASASDLTRAQQRYRWLHPQPNDAPCPHSERSLRQWRAWWRDGEAQYGSGFVGLIGREHQRGNRTRRLDPKVLQIIADVIEHYALTPPRPSLVVCWGEVINRCNAVGLPAPSEKAFRREVARIPKHQQTAAREGERAAYSTEEFFWHLEQHTPRHGDRGFEIGHIDHTELDLQLVSRRFGRRLTARVWLTLMIDAFTRSILAWYLTFDPPSYRSCMSVMRNCVRAHGRIPGTLVVDGGAEFDSRYFEQLVARLDGNKRSRPAGKPRHGSVIERHFGMSNQQFVHNLRGNTQASRDPRSMSDSHDPRRHAVWTLATFATALGQFFDDRNRRYQHAATGVTAHELLAASERAFGRRGHKMLPWTEELAMYFVPYAPDSPLTVHPGRGVKFREIFYWCDLFREGRLQGKKLEFRYDPFDISTGYVWVAASTEASGEWVKVRSEHAAVFLDRSEREIAIATEELRELRVSAGRRRKLNASLLAEHLMSADGSERRLLQQWRDEERQAAEAKRSTHSIEIPLSGTAAAKKARIRDPWAIYQQPKS